MSLSHFIASEVTNKTNYYDTNTITYVVRYITKRVNKPLLVQRMKRLNRIEPMRCQQLPNELS